ncbi:NERD domain-containing protein, partial [Escherichia coli]|nr:NERD domain-containing protein [Escherichia coli]
MAKLINVSASTEERMTSGERRVASRLESFLNDDCLVWYDIPVGRRNRHPDFVIIDPENGLVFWICPYISRHLLSLNPLQA